MKIALWVQYNIILGRNALLFTVRHKMMMNLKIVQHCIFVVRTEILSETSVTNWWLNYLFKLIHSLIFYSMDFREVGFGIFGNPTISRLVRFLRNMFFFVFSCGSRAIIWDKLLTMKFCLLVKTTYLYIFPTINRNC